MQHPRLARLFTDKTNAIIPPFAPFNSGFILSLSAESRCVRAQMDNSSKRRRLDPPRNNTRNAPIVQSPAESSSDELAAGSDHDEARRRTSWSIQKAYPPKRPYPRSRSFSGSESPDELAVDAEEYWRSSRRNRGRRSPSPVQDSDMMSERYGDDEEDMDEEAEDTDQQDEQEVEAGDAEDEGDDGEYSDRSPTPVPPPPPPPPKPDRLNYKEKYLLRGHLRGISAVRFSPDASMIASGGMQLLPCYFSLRVTNVGC